MFNLVFFLKKIVRAIWFTLQIIWKAFILFFKRRKQLQKNYLYNYRKFIFLKSYLFVHIEYRNAFWYRVNGGKRKIKLNPFAIDVEFLKQPFVEILIQGWFQKKILRIDVDVAFKLKSESFLAFTNFRGKVYPKMLTIKPKSVYPSTVVKSYNFKKKSFLPLFKRHLKPHFKVPQIQIIHSLFIQNDFI